ncbi:UNVERIFIED_CONTAM: hypothetical protein RMT77_005788 [Armadillidium vulgare]
MLKFRMTNSMKARRAAETQRKALEEKLKMEWAWKPMAAVMNEKETDLVYWVPPLYTSTLLNSLSSSTASTPYSSKRSSLTDPSVPSTPVAQIRRRKLAQRRYRLIARNSIPECESEDSEFCEMKRKEDFTTDEDKESGIQDEFLDSSLEEDLHFEDTFNRTNHLKHSLKKLDRQKTLPERKQKLCHLPILLKVINKLSEMYTLPVTPQPPMYGASRPLKTKEVKGERKPKRPSVKIYKVPPQRPSLRRMNSTQEEQPFYVISKNKNPFGESQKSKKRFSIQSQASTTTSERTHIGLPTLSENDLRKAHLDMILKILTNLYEEKLIHQDTEIAHLKSKILLQEKVIKQTAHIVLDMKEHLRTLQAKYDYNEELKKFYTNARQDSESSVEYQRLEPLVEEGLDISSKSTTNLNNESEERDGIQILHINSEKSNAEGTSSSEQTLNAQKQEFKPFSAQISTESDDTESQNRNGTHISVLNIEIT